MNHKIELVNCNTVIIASTFSVNTLNSVWLYKNKIFTEKELREARHLAMILEVQTNNFHLQIIPDRLQFTISPKYKNTTKLLLSKIGNLIKLLPHTSFLAVGLNFTYHVAPLDKDICKLSRSLFCNEKSKLFNDFKEQNVRFGGYFSKDVLGTRFRLAAKPIEVENKNIKKEILQFSYNFNLALTQNDNYNKVIDLFSKWNMAKSICRKLTNKINVKD